VKGVGEPCAGEPHARFDGGELEKERLWQPNMAALGKPRDLSPVRPTVCHLASSLPDRTISSHSTNVRIGAEGGPVPPKAT
jgi:hypothetical protein